MTPAIPADLLQKLQAVLSSTPGVRSAWIFGSRATGCNKPTSDIDLAVSGPLSHIELSRLRLDLEDLPTLCLIDLVHLDSLENKALKDAIHQEGILIFKQ